MMIPCDRPEQACPDQVSGSVPTDTRKEAAPGKGGGRREPPSRVTGAIS